MRRERPEDTEESPSKLQKDDSGQPVVPAPADDTAPVAKPRSKVRKGTECPYLDTIARQVPCIPACNTDVDQQEFDQATAAAEP